MIKVVMLWLVNEKGELLLARRSDHKKQDPGLWGPSVTGRLENGEAFEEALAREVDEELALKPIFYSPDFLFETDFAHPDGEIRRFRIYAAAVSKNITEQLVMDTDEVAEIKWLPINEIKELLNGKPGEVVPASAFVLWDQIFKVLEEKMLVGGR